MMVSRSLFMFCDELLKVAAITGCLCATVCTHKMKCLTRTILRSQLLLRLSGTFHYCSQAWLLPAQRWRRSWAWLHRNVGYSISNRSERAESLFAANLCTALWRGSKLSRDRLNVVQGENTYVTENITREFKYKTELNDVWLKQGQWFEAFKTVTTEINTLCEFN